MAVHNAILGSTLSYGRECWVRQKKHENRVNAVEMTMMFSNCALFGSRVVYTSITKYN